MTVGRAAPLLFLGALLLGCASAERWTDEGDAALRDNRLEDAERAYDRALSADPHHAPALYGKGWVYYASGLDSLRPVARDLFQRAIDYDPAFFGGWRGKGVMLLDDGKVPAAEKALREAARLAPREASALESLGRHYLRARRTPEARRLFEASLAAAPERGELRRLIAEVELAEADHEGALREVALGRESPLSGRRGLLMLDDIESIVRAEWVRASLDGAIPALDPTLALQHLDRADSLLESTDALGFSPIEVRQRRTAHRALRERLASALAKGRDPAKSTE